MKARPTLFLSGVSHEFGSFRDAVEIQIQMKGCFPENQPSFPPTYEEVERMLTRRIEGADAVICLVGFRYGAEPWQRPEGVRRRSYTQMEFDIALSLGKPVYRFLSDEILRPRDPPEPEEGEEDPEAQALQLEHRRNLIGTNHLYYYFRDKEDLCRQVAEIPLVAQADFKIDASRIVQFGPPRLFGRETHLARLDTAMNDADTRVACRRLAPDGPESRGTGVLQQCRGATDRERADASTLFAGWLPLLRSAARGDRTRRLAKVPGPALQQQVGPRFAGHLRPSRMAGVAVPG